MTMQVTYRYSPLECLLAHCYTMPRMPIVKYAFLAILAINLVMSFGSDHVFAYQLTLALMGTIFATGVGLVFATLMMVLASWSRKSQLVTINEGGVTLASGDKETRAGWSTFLKLHVGNRFLFVKMDNGCHLAIPRRTFANDPDERACIGFLESKVGSS